MAQRLRDYAYLVWDIWDISPLNIGHEMDPVLAKRVRERKGLIKGSNGSRR